MAAKFLVLAAFVAVASAGGVKRGLHGVNPAHPGVNPAVLPGVNPAALPGVNPVLPGVTGVPSAVNGADSYSYSYGVRDLNTGDVKDVHEQRVGNNVFGQYSLLESDGTKRVVEYAANPQTGFNAVVRKEGLATHPPSPVQPYAAARSLGYPGALAQPGYAPGVPAPLAGVNPLALGAANPLAYGAHANPLAYSAHTGAFGGYSAALGPNAWAARNLGGLASPLHGAYGAGAYGAGAYGAGAYGAGAYGLAQGPFSPLAQGPYGPLAHGAYGPLAPGAYGPHGALPHAGHGLAPNALANGARW